jgi:NAD(P)-dependent dehydrogenase (short-subunit alcohol dehydrogenase family)
MDIALVTGADAGPGLAIARRLIGMGCRVYALATQFARNPFPHDDFIPLTCDLADPAALTQAVEDVLAREGHVSFVVHAARRVPTPLFDSPVAALTERLHVGLLAPLALARATLPWLRKEKGHFLVLCWNGDGPAPGGPVTAAIEGGLLHFTNQLFDELRDDGVRASTVYARPNLETPADAALALDPQSSVNPELVADAVEQLFRLRPSNVVSTLVLRPAATAENPRLPRSTELAGLTTREVQLPPRSLFPRDPEGIPTPKRARPADAPPPGTEDFDDEDEEDEDDTWHLQEDNLPASNQREDSAPPRQGNDRPDDNRPEGNREGNRPDGYRSEGNREGDRADSGPPRRPQGSQQNYDDRGPRQGQGPGRRSRGGRGRGRGGRDRYGPDQRYPDDRQGNYPPRQGQGDDRGPNRPSRDGHPDDNRPRDDRPRDDRPRDAYRPPVRPNEPPFRPREEYSDDTRPSSPSRPQPPAGRPSREDYPDSEGEPAERALRDDSFRTPHSDDDSPSGESSSREGDYRDDSTDRPPSDRPPSNRESDDDSPRRDPDFDGPGPRGDEYTPIGARSSSSNDPERDRPPGGYGDSPSRDRSPGNSPDRGPSDRDSDRGQSDRGPSDRGSDRGSSQGPPPRRHRGYGRRPPPNSGTQRGPDSD